MNRILLTGAGLAALCSAGIAQDLVAIPGPITPLKYNLATGHASLTAPWNPAADTAGTTFANVTTSGFYATPLTAEEWVDWGVKAGGLSTVVCTLEIGYGTLAVDPTLGGPGASLELAVYEGTLGGCNLNDVANEVRRLTLTGLPGSTDGAPAGYTLQIPLEGDAFHLNDGAIGWSYVGIDGVTGPLSVTVGADPTSTVDGYDLYVPAPAASGLCLGTFTFLTPGTGSFYLRMEEDDGTEAGSQVVRPGSGVNLGVLSLGTGPPKIGQTWDPSITTPAVPTPVLDFIAISTTPLPPVVVPGFGEILVTFTSPNLLFSSVLPVGQGSPFALPFPLNCDTIGVALTCQAGQADAGGTFGLTDAIDFVIGI